MTLHGFPQLIFAHQIRFRTIFEVDSGQIHRNKISWRTDETARNHFLKQPVVITRPITLGIDQLLNGING